MQIQSHTTVKTNGQINFSICAFAAYIKILLKEKYLDDRARADEDVLRLHVPMDDAIGVQIIQRFYLKKACILLLREIPGTAGTINNSTPKPVQL